MKTTTTQQYHHYYHETDLMKQCKIFTLLTIQVLIRKVRPLIDELNEQCLANYLPEQSVTTDESMVPYFGRHSCKQYMRIKPIKFGYKFSVAATPLGYAIQFYLYAGKDENYDSNLGLGGSVVVTLAEKLPSQVGSNYDIIMDNFFASPNLQRNLKAKSIAATGILRIIVSRMLLYNQ